MANFVVMNKFFEFGLTINDNILDNYKDLNTYLEPYIFINKVNNFVYDNYIKVDKCIDVCFNNYEFHYDDNTLLLLKRIIIDICNRYIEDNNAIFLHSSSVINDNKSIVFTGSKGAGKTKMLLSLLDSNKFNFSSNDRTAIYLDNGIIKTFGNPSAINVRASTIDESKSIQNKIIPVIDKKEYDKLSKMNLSNNCLERIYLKYQDLLKIFNIDACSIGELKYIINLTVSDKYLFHFEEVDFDEFRDVIDSNLISGVNENRLELEKVIDSNYSSNYDYLNNSNVKFINIYKNNSEDSSKRLIKRLIDDGVIE